MITSMDCIPCLIRQTRNALKLIMADNEVSEKTMRRVLEEASGFDYRRTPPEMAGIIHRIIREETGSDDPYRIIKNNSTWAALDIVKNVEESIACSSNPFETAVNFAIAGNVIDFARYSKWDEKRLNECLEKALTNRFDSEILKQFKSELESANFVLYLADNAGETVFDLLLINRIPCKKIIYAVKGSPVINDAVKSDAYLAGIDEVAKIVDNGSDVSGTVLDLCSDEFRRLFYNAGVVISKGQGNFESLKENERRIFFLTQVKCSLIAGDLCREVGDWVLTTTDVLREHKI